MTTTATATKPARRIRWARLLSPWWMAGKPSEAHLARSLAILIACSVLTGWLFATADHLAVLGLRFLVWVAMAVPVWGVVVTAGVLWKMYRPKDLP